MKKSKNFKNILAFTLIELIIVIAIITLLAGIVIVTINPSQIFANGRNSRRSSDLSAIQTGINKYLAETPLTGTLRSINDLTGYSNLYYNALNNIGGKCSNGVNGVTSTIQGAFNIDNTTTNGSIDLSPLISNNYIPKLLTDPNGNKYKACIDPVNGNQLVVYADNTENAATFATNTVGSFTGNIDISSSNSGLVGYWKMNDASGNSVTDYSGNNNTGIASNTTIGLGNFGTSRTFSGSSLLSVPSSSSLNSISTQLTIGMWIYPTSSSTWGRIITRNVYPNQDYYIEFDSSSLNLHYGTYTNNEDRKSVNTVNLNQWNYIAMTISTTAINLYINNTLDSSITTSILPLSTSGTLYIGSELGNASFTGAIDEVRIYNQVLSSAQLTALYNYAPSPVAYYNFNSESGTTITDRSGNNNSGTWSGTGSHWTTGKYGNAGNFNGSSDTLDLSDNSTIDPVYAMTEEAWLNIGNGNGSNVGILCKDIGGAITTCPYSIELINTNTFVCRYTFSGNTNNTSQKGTWLTNTWYHVACVYDGINTISTYVNGQLVDSSSGIVGNIASTTGSLHIGQQKSGFSRFFLGQIDEVKIYNYARTQNQIQADMS